MQGQPRATAGKWPRVRVSDDGTHALCHQGEGRSLVLSGGRPSTDTDAISVVRIRIRHSSVWACGPINLHSNKKTD